MRYRALRLVGFLLLLVLASGTWAQSILKGMGPWHMQGSTSAGQWVKYALDIRPTDGIVKFEIVQVSGSLELYIREGNEPTATAYDLHPGLSSGSATTSLTNDSNPAL